MSNKKVTITYNGSQILPQTELSNSNVIYNGNTIISDGEYTKTLNCANQVMASNITVGTKILNCNGQLMTSNVTIVSENAIIIAGDKPTNLTPTATYTGSEITNGYNCPTGISMTGNDRGTNVGNYTATYTPNTGYCWSDMTTDAVSVNLYIKPVARFICGSGSGGKTYYSTDGVNWNAMSLYDYSAYRGIAYGKNRFVAVTQKAQQSGSIGVPLCTTNGTDWYDYGYFTMSTPPIQRAICYGNDRFVCVGTKGTSYYCTTSSSKSKWTAMSGLSNALYQSVTYGNGRFVCVGASGNSYYSTDGVTWNVMSGLASDKSYNGVTYGNGRFVCVGGAYYSETGYVSAAYYSTDGVTWNVMSGLAATIYNAVAYGNGRFVCVGDDGIAYYSTDGVNWNAMSGLSATTYNAVAYGNGRFVCVGMQGVAYYSTNGVTWTAMSGLDSDKGYYSIAYGDFN